MKKVFVFPFIIGKVFVEKMSFHKLFRSKFLNLKQSFYKQLQCYLTKIFKNYDNIYFKFLPFSEQNINISHSVIAKFKLHNVIVSVSSTDD